MGAKQYRGVRAEVVAKITGSTSIRSRVAGARLAKIGAAGVLCLGLAACGGRPSNPVSERTDLDGQLSCTHVIAEKRALKKRVADLRDERNTNRVRSIGRVPGALISGNPFSAIFFADPSVAIYKEIAAADRRQRVLDQLLAEKGCIETRAASAAPSPSPKPAAAAVEPSPEAPPIETASTQPETPKEGGGLIETWRGSN